MDKSRALLLLQEIVFNAMKFAIADQMGFNTGLRPAAEAAARACSEVFYELTGEYATLDEMSQMMSKQI